MDEKELFLHLVVNQTLGLRFISDFWGVSLGMSGGVISMNISGLLSIFNQIPRGMHIYDLICSGQIIANIHHFIWSGQLHRTGLDRYSDQRYPENLERCYLLFPKKYYLLFKKHSFETNKKRIKCILKIKAVTIWHSITFSNDSLLIKIKAKQSNDVWTIWHFHKQSKNWIKSQMKF